MRKLLTLLTVLSLSSTLVAQNALPRAKDDKARLSV